jgi:uncharacterized protein DUF6600
MFPAVKWLRVVAVAVPILLVSSAFAYDVDDDDIPDVTARVARISYVEDDVQIHRAGSDDWEKATMNLPLVEGDEIATTAFAKLEIQFDSRTFLRVPEKSLVRIVTLQDSGVALSVPQGSVSIRVYDFDKDRSYFEVDIPNSTVAIERSGSYRIDTGDKDSYEAHIRVTDGGQARIYSDTSGFTLRSDRAATVYLAGVRASEWDTFDASAFSDSFDDWTLDRDKAIAKRLRDSFYDKYYDRDIYGAEDLTDYGEWTYSRSYGYVWRPFGSSLQGYSDWSPYRYGHWRWLSPFGWTWINDEPWGWATYHYGRWVWDSNGWVWSPYGYYRTRRSWWTPGMVVISVISNNVCWYPLGYYSHYYDYNHHHHRNGGGGNNGPGPVPTPTPAGPTATRINDARRKQMQRDNVPPGGVVMTSVEDFGRGRSGIRRPPVEVARTVTSKDPDTVETPPILPPIEQVERRMAKEVRADTPPIIQTYRTVKTGAAERTANRPLDDDLRRTRNFGNRPPLEVQNPAPTPTAPTTTTTETPASDTNTQRTETRRTGAVNRPQSRPVEAPPSTTPPIIATPTENKKPDMPKKEERRVETPKTEQPRIETPRRIETPKYDSPPTRNETPRSEAPKREEPRSEPKRSDLPSQKSEPKSEPKVVKPSAPSEPKKRDGR